MLSESGAHLQGHFCLTSGLHSAHYLQCALLLRFPTFAAFAGEALARRLEPRCRSLSGHRRPHHRSRGGPCPRCPLPFLRTPGRRHDATAFPAPWSGLFRRRRGCHHDRRILSRSRQPHRTGRSQVGGDGLCRRSKRRFSPSSRRPALSLGGALRDVEPWRLSPLRPGVAVGKARKPCLNGIGR